MPWPVLLNVNQTVVKPFGQLIEIVEINNVGSNCWVTIDGNYVAGPYQQNVISLPAPESVATCELTSTAAPGQANPSNPQGVAILHFHPFAPGPLGVNAPLPNPGVIVGGTGWGAGSPGNTLKALAAGDPFRVDQVNQLINLLTGVMTGQSILFSGPVFQSNSGIELLSANPLELQDAAGNRKEIFHGSDTLVFTDDALGTIMELANNGQLTLPGKDANNIALRLTGTQGGISLFDASNPQKTKQLQCVANAFVVVNDAHTAIIFQVDDSGNMTVSGTADIKGALTAESTLTLDGLTPHHFEAGSVTSSAAADTTVNFKAAYGSTPAIVMTTTTDLAANLRLPSVVTSGTTSFTFNVRDNITGNRTVATCNWLAFQQT